MRKLGLTCFVVSIVVGIALAGCTSTAPVVAPTPQPAGSAPVPTVAVKSATTPDKGAPVATPAAAAAKASAPAKLEKVKLATVVKGGGYINYYLSKDKGFYAAEGLDVDVSEMKGPLHAPAMASGQLDFSAAATSPEFFVAALKGAPIKALMTVNKKPTWYIVGGPGVNSIDEVKGKPIGVTSIGSFSHFGVVQSLKLKGLDPDKDVTYVPISGIPERMNALKAKSIVATFFSTPEQATAQKEYGWKVLVDMGEILDLPLDSMGTTDKKIKENPDQVKRMIRGVLKGMAYIRDNREDSIAYMAKELNLSSESAEVLYADMVRTYAYDGLISDKGLQNLAMASLEGGDVPGVTKDNVRTEKGVDLTLLKEVLKDYRP